MKNQIITQDFKLAEIVELVNEFEEGEIVWEVNDIVKAFEHPKHPSEFNGVILQMGDIKKSYTIDEYRVCEAGDLFGKDECFPTIQVKKYKSGKAKFTFGGHRYVNENSSLKNGEIVYPYFMDNEAIAVYNHDKSEDEFFVNEDL